MVLSAGNGRRELLNFRSLVHRLNTHETGRNPTAASFWRSGHIQWDADVALSSDTCRMQQGDQKSQGHISYKLELVLAQTKDRQDAYYCD
jgi:hypothetical protein